MGKDGKVGREPPVGGAGACHVFVAGYCLSPHGAYDLDVRNIFTIYKKHKKLVRKAPNEVDVSRRS
jgi:hypothetical protein